MLLAEQRDALCPFRARCILEEAERRAARFSGLAQAYGLGWGAGQPWIAGVVGLARLERSASVSGLVDRAAEGALEQGSVRLSCGCSKRAAG